MVNFKVSSSIGAGATAQISIPSNPMAHELKPRSLVHIFFFEDRFELGAEQYSEGSGPRKYYGNKHLLDLEARKSAKQAGKTSRLHDYKDIMNWKLLFTGEIVGYGFSKIGGIRNINLICQDFTSYYQMAQMYWGPNSGKLDSKKKAIFLGATRLYSNGKKVNNQNKLTDILTSKPNGKLQPAGILGGIVSLLESATGVFSPGENGKAHRGVNDMLSYAELKYHLTRTIAASDKDQTASIFMNNATFKKWLKRVGESTQNTTSFIQLISAILPHVHYEWNSILAPPFVPASESLATYRTKTLNVKYKGGGDLSEFIRRCKESEKAVKQYLWDFAWSDGWVSKFPAGVDTTAFSPEYDPETKQHKRNAEMKTLFDKLTSNGHLAQWSPQTIMNKAEEIRKSMYEKSASGENKSRIRARADQIVFGYSEGKQAVFEIKKHKANVGNVRVYHLKQIQILLERALEKAGGGLAKPTKTLRGENIQANSRLHMTMFRPDLYMCPPPKCNVLFPDMITSIFYSRNWMSEVTRLWLFTRQRSGRSRQDMYFSPNTTILGGGDKSSTEKAVRDRINFHMDHEKFTGIVAQFDGVADWAQMKKAYQKQIKEGGEKDPRNNGHLHRAANFIFFKRRYQGRVIRLNLRYSPQLVTGLPCLVLDPIEGTDRFQLMDPDLKVDKLYLDKHVSRGTHYLGVIHSVEHIGDGSGGAETKVVLTHCRTHMESADIFGGRDKPSNWVYTSFTTKKYVGKKKVENMGKDAGGNETYDQDDRRVMGNQLDPKATYIYERVEDASGNVERTHFEPGYVSVTGKSAADHPSEHKFVAGGPAYTPFADYPIPDFGADSPGESWTEYRVPAVYMNVYKRVRGESGKQVNFTFEAAVTPPWYSSIFLPNKIGEEFYKDMLGCKSVIDEPAIIFPATAESNADAVAEEDANTSNASTTPEPDGLYPNVDKEEVELVEIVQNLPQYNNDTLVHENVTVMVPKVLLEKTKSASYAADNLAETWLGLKRMKSDINMFIDTYVDRSYATMLDIFGNTNDYAYKGVKSLGVKGKYKDEMEVEGFHGQAFGLKENLADLEGANQSLVADPKGKGRRRSVKQEIDTRTDKYSAVLEYKRLLLASMKDFNE